MTNHSLLLLLLATSVTSRKSVILQYNIYKTIHQNQKINFHYNQKDDNQDIFYYLIVYNFISKIF